MIKTTIKKLEDMKLANRELFRFYVFMEREAHRKGNHEEKSYWLDRVCDIDAEIDRLDGDIKLLKGES